MLSNITSSLIKDATTAGMNIVNDVVLKPAVPAAISGVKYGAQFLGGLFVFGMVLPVGVAVVAAGSKVSLTAASAAEQGIAYAANNVSDGYNYVSGAISSWWNKPKLVTSEQGHAIENSDGAEFA